MEKKKTLTIKPEDFSAYLLGRRGNMNLAEFAASLDISEPLAYKLLSGSRPPSAAILKKLNGREETVYVFDLTPDKKVN